MVFISIVGDPLLDRHKVLLINVRREQAGKVGEGYDMSRDRLPIPWLIQVTLYSKNLVGLPHVKRVSTAGGLIICWLPVRHHAFGQR